MLTSHDLNTATRELRAMMNDAEQMLRDAGETTGSKAAELQKDGMALLSGCLSKAHELERKAIRSTKEGIATADAIVHANPWRTAAVSGLLGAGVGLILGLAVSRK